MLLEDPDHFLFYCKAYDEERGKMVEKVEEVLNREGQDSIGDINLRVCELNGRVLDSRLKGPGFEPHLRHCIVSLSKNINPSLDLVLVQTRKTCPFITERLLMGSKESYQTNK